MVRAIKVIGFLFFFLFNAMVLKASTGVLFLEGIYQGENLYITNPDRESSVGKSIKRITVNGIVASDEIQSSSIEIDLSLYQLEIGDTVEIKIFYDEEFTPKVINPEVLMVSENLLNNNSTSDTKIIKFSIHDSKNPLQPIENTKK